MSEEARRLVTGPVRDDGQVMLFPESDVAPARPNGACVNWDDCGNLSAGGEKANNEICDSCLDESRNRGRGHDLPNHDE